jgi:hypothetical protein
LLFVCGVPSAARPAITTQKKSLREAGFFQAMPVDLACIETPGSMQDKPRAMFTDEHARLEALAV